jgi:hypothetical protein
MTMFWKFWCEVDLLWMIHGMIAGRTISGECAGLMLPIRAGLSYQ